MKLLNCCGRKPGDKFIKVHFDEVLLYVLNIMFKLMNKIYGTFSIPVSKDSVTQIMWKLRKPMPQPMAPILNQSFCLHTIE